jgi:hypothetical protein
MIRRAYRRRHSCGGQSCWIIGNAIAIDPAQCADVKDDPFHCTSSDVEDAGSTENCKPAVVQGTLAKRTLFGEAQG